MNVNFEEIEKAWFEPKKDNTIDKLLKENKEINKFKQYFIRAFKEYDTGTIEGYIKAVNNAIEMYNKN